MEVIVLRNGKQSNQTIILMHPQTKDMMPSLSAIQTIFQNIGRLTDHIGKFTGYLLLSYEPRQVQIRHKSLAVAPPLGAIRRGRPKKLWLKRRCNKLLIMLIIMEGRSKWRNRREST